jgi:hypothetical protein
MGLLFIEKTLHAGLELAGWLFLHGHPLRRVSWLTPSFNVALSATAQDPVGDLPQLSPRGRHVKHVGRANLGLPHSPVGSRSPRSHRAKVLGSMPSCTAASFCDKPKVVRRRTARARYPASTNCLVNTVYRLVRTAEVAHNDAGDLNLDLSWVRADATVAALRNAAAPT